MGAVGDVLVAGAVERLRRRQPPPVVVAEESAEPESWRSAAARPGDADTTRHPVERKKKNDK